MELSELRGAFSERGIRKVKVGGADVDGILRGTHISPEKFWSAVETGFRFCDGIFGRDVGDHVYDHGSATGWRASEANAVAQIDPSTFRVLPSEPDTACFLADFWMNDRKHPHPACPRNLLKRVVARAEGTGYQPMFGSTLQFWIFQETSDSLHDKDFDGLEPLSRGTFGYSWVRAGQLSELVHEVIDSMRSFGVPVEGLHTASGPGVWEVALRHSDAVEAADRCALFKATLKQLLAQHGLSVTFMAKWNAALPDSSGHLHQCLLDSTGETNLFHDGGKEHEVSDLARHYVGGLVALARELTALYSPFVNSYKRFAPGVHAPITPSWGIDDRSCTARMVTSGQATHVEYRQPAADLNPYLAMATCLGAGLYGIEHAIDPGEPRTGDATTSEGVEPLPLTLEHSLSALAESDAAKEILGEAFVDHYVRSRDWEVRQYRAAVTDWELRRYFEAV